MSPAVDRSLFEVESVFVAVLAVGWAVALLAWRLGRARPGLALGLPVAVALVVRTLAAGAVSLTPIATSLRGGDEINFLAQADALVATGGSDAWLEAFTSDLYLWLFAVQDWALGDPPEFALRIVQIGIATAGLLLLATAVHDLAGRRAGLIAAWALALEPANVFFSSFLHKEPLMLLAGGLVAYGGVQLWRRGDLTALVPLVLGSLIGTATRPYAGWFLVAASAFLVLHAALRTRRSRPRHAFVLVAAVVLLATLTAPAAWRATSDNELAALQGSQDANVADASNLKLERVDFGTRSDLALNLPQRIRDVVFRPYLWQVGNMSQRVGVLGTVVVLVVLALLAAALARNRGRILDRAAPLIYPAVLTLVVYSLSAGNAGTAFRYRTHVVAFAICIIVALWQRSRSPEAESQELPHREPPRGLALAR